MLFGWVDRDGIGKRCEEAEVYGDRTQREGNERVAVVGFKNESH